MERQSESSNDTILQTEVVPMGSLKTTIACVAGVLVPGLGHALLRKWDRAIVFFGCILLLISMGIHLDGRIFDPDFSDLFTTLKFVADAGAGLFYWIPWFHGAGKGELTAYTYDYANVFIYVAGLLNMLTVVDVFDIAMGRKR
jgi:hypothetical protein